jgi:transposase
MRMRAMNVTVKRKGAQRRYSPELKERAVRMVRQLRAETGERHGSVKRVAEQLDIGPESLRSWVRQDEIDRGESAGTTTADAERLKQLEQENKELRRANAILKSASAFFAAELDRPQR